MLNELPEVAEATDLFERRALITVVVACVCLPMLYIDSVAPLEPLAVFSIMAIQLLLAVILCGVPGF